ncbi:MAG: hypothetical protein LUG18_06120 [Candidatus Azobacteroides sp.]|nr:hypothetical protein [Candidatus Azobacteroides sp.]
MSKLNSLILLIKSLSKSEKKALVLHASQTEDSKLYLDLFHIIDKEKYASTENITGIFRKKHPASFLAANVRYLFDLILQVVVELNSKKNKEYELYHSYLKSRILRERGLYDDYLSSLQETKEKAKEIGEYTLLLTLQRDELKSDLLNYFDQIKNEEELFRKQQAINENLKIIRQINEQSFLYEMLRFKVEKQKSTQSDQPYVYNDLLISEMSLVSSLKNEIFEISRLHQLFQANYFINTGSYKSALNAFSELNQLFLKNEKYWNNPPVYYLMTLIGVLESLSRMRLFKEMDPYKKQLSVLIEKYPYVSFVLEVNAFLFIYSVIPHMYNKEYKECLHIISRYKEILTDKLLSLPPRLFLGVSICLAGIYLMNKEFGKAKKQLIPISHDNAFSSLKIFRSVQLMNLIIYHELGDTDYIESVIRSIKRKNKKTNEGTQVERFLFRYLETDWILLPSRKKEIQKEKLRNEIKNIKYSIDDLQLIRFFDFSEWIVEKLQ